MKRRIFKYILTMLIFVLCASSFTLNVSDVIPLQKDLETKAQTLLDKYLGPNMGLANVIISLRKENITTYTSVNEENKTNNKAAAENGDNQDSNKLPGYSLLANQKQKVYDTVSSVAKTSTQVYVDRDVAKIDVSLIIDKKIPQKQVDGIKPIIIEVLKLNVARGDSVSVMRLDLVSSKEVESKVQTFGQKLASSLKSSDFIKLYVIYAMIFLVLIFITIVFIIGVIIFARSTKKIQQEVVTDQSTVIKKDENQQEDDADTVSEFIDAKDSKTGQRSAGQTIHTVKMVDGEEPVFSFINMQNINKFAYLLKNESTEKKVAALNFLQPDVAAKLFESFPLLEQKDLVLKLSNEIKLAPEAIKAYAKEVEYQIDFLAGGKVFTNQIFDHMNQDISRSILKEVEKENVALAKEISNTIYEFTDLKLIDKRYVQYVVRTIGVKDISIALSVMDEDFQQFVYANLSEGVTDLIKQSLRLLQKQPKSRISEIQLKTVQLLRTLNKEGLIPDKSELSNVEKSEA